MTMIDRMIPWLAMLGASLVPMGICLTAQAQPPKAGRILFLGNSITMHGPLKDINWAGNWGMAASAEENDYVHVLARSISQMTGIASEVMLENISDFERKCDAFNVNERLKKAFEFRADTVIVAIGENVPAFDSEEAKARFRDCLMKLLIAIKTNSSPAIFVRSCFWPCATDEILKDASKEIGGVFVDISGLSKDESNYARSEREYSHPGVGAHPGDKGMKAIADALFEVIKPHVIAPAALQAHARAARRDALADGFAAPPLAARLRGYWDWLNSNVTREAITKDLEWMKRIGMGGGLVFDVGGATQGGHAPVPVGPLFGSPEWRGLFSHALREADRLGLEIGLSLQSGWNLGGPMVTPEKAAKIVTWSQLQVDGPTNLAVKLPAPPATEQFYRDTFVLAYRRKTRPAGHKPIRKLAEKAACLELGGSATDCSPLLEDDPATPGEEDLLASDALDLTDKLDRDGTLRWAAPAGAWVVLRFGYTNNGARVSTSSDNWQGLVLDYLDADALRWYWREVIDPIIADAGPLAGRVWKMVQTDSWELGGVNWTAAFPAEFQKRRGYDVRPWLPVLAGRIVESRDASNRFLADFRRTIADCIADNHYGTMAALAHEHGLGIQPESAGPHTAPLDGLMCYGRSDWPMSEFWVPSPHRPADGQRFFVKQAASAAHIYGKPIVCAEGFTSIGPQWSDVLWNMQKPSFDHEACAGLNLVFWHGFVCSPKEMGLPGQEFFAGTHFSPQITWSNQAHAFVSYLNRCQFLLQQGQFVADVLYYYGNHVPNIARLKQDDPAKVLPQYDYDVINEEVLLQAGVKDGRVTLPSGMSYRVLVLPNLKVMSLEAARKLRDLAAAGAAIVGPQPGRTTGRQDDAELQRLAGELWDSGKITTRSAQQAVGVPPDVEGLPDWIHRRSGDADIYFVCNQQAQPARHEISFRVSGKQPELWDPVSGTRRNLPEFTATADGRITVPLQFAAYQSFFVVFRSRAAGALECGGSTPLSVPGSAKAVASDRAPGSSASGTRKNFPGLKPVVELTGPWEVTFGKQKLTFDKLVDWTTRPEVRYFSGTATYRKVFDLPEPRLVRRSHGEGGTLNPLFLDLGNLSMLAEVRLNGNNLGVVWCPPWRVEITGIVKATGNELAVDVVNGWWNQLVGDPQHERTKTNIRLDSKAQPQASGLLGPVQLLEEEQP